MKLRIAHLYPAELGINGDVGNVLILARRARARGHEVEVLDIGIGADLPGDVDIVHIGSGPFTAVQTVQPDAKRHADILRSLRDDGAPILAIGGGWELLGRRIVHESDTVEGLGVFPSEAIREQKQSVGETVVVVDGGEIVTGYANHGSRTSLQDDARAFGTVRRGYGNNGSGAPDTGDEGVRVGASIGTHLHGCVLGMNPGLADELLRAAIERRGGGGALATLPPELQQADEWAARSRAALRARVGDGS